MSKTEKEQNHISSLYLGTFNSEQFWRDHKISRLPTITDLQSDTIVTIMDELKFVFCDSDEDLVITHLPMDDAHKNYLWNLGFSFRNNEFPLIEDNNREELYHDKGIEQRLIETDNYEYFKGLISPLSKFNPYSILPLTEAFCVHYNLQNSHPNFDIVKKVNSKVFSHQLAKKLFEDKQGEIVYSARELEIQGNLLLKYSPFLIKDEFGVSGKGNLLIPSSQILQRIVRYIAKQESKGYETRFLLEPLLDKKIDFSCQFEIEATGNINIWSIQKMQNSGFAFSDIQTSEIYFQEKLEQLGYFSQVKLIAEALYQEGYYGSVCIDSMLLENEKIVPIIEINARKSMGFINYYIDLFLAQFSTQGCLTFFSLGLSEAINFEQILEIMKQENILFMKERPKGILPLSANSLNVNYKLNQDKNYQTYKGRFYVTIVSNCGEKKMFFIKKMKQIFTKLGIQQFD